MNSREEKIALIVVTVFFTCGFTFTFLPLLNLLLQKTLPFEWYTTAALIAFPLSMGVACLVESPAALVNRSPIAPNGWKMSVVPILLSFGFGMIRGSAPLDAGTHIWILFSAPLGEEFIFRGWFYSFLNRQGGKNLWSHTNPLPTTVWLSAAAFSMWHLQNWGQSSTTAVLFQLFTTFFVGTWLGILRWKTESIWSGVVCHCLLNATTELGGWLMLK